MNNKGFAVAGILYSILILFIIFIVLIMFNLQNKKRILDKLKTDTLNTIENNVTPNDEICSVETGYVWNFDYNGTNGSDGSAQTFEAPCTGNYKLEVWGAQGGSVDANTSNGGKGGYASGDINLEKNKNLYIYVGNQPTLAINSYNGGGNTNNSHYPTSDGGGSTDIRLTNGLWNNFDSLKSRIIVAGAGGGDQGYSNTSGGAGGGLLGYSGTYGGQLTTPYSIPTGGTQNSGGIGDATIFSGSNGGFGFGGNGDLDYGGGAGGAGYYGGGGGGNYHHVATGGGGSSFISGYSGCNAINTLTSTSSNIVHTNNPTLNYDGVNYTFSNAIMIDGAGCDWSTGSATNCGANQPQPDGTNAVGHSGNGYARITYLGGNNTAEVSATDISYTHNNQTTVDGALDDLFNKFN